MANGSATFDLKQLAADFPETAATMLVDVRLTDEAAASSRMFRVYKPVPPHFHATCDEYLLVVSGRGQFVIEGHEPVDLGPGELVFFSVDTPRRDPGDVTFVNPKDGTVEAFLRSIPY